MDFYKDFIQRLTKITFDDVYLLLHGNICPMLKKFIILLDNIKFKDGEYHTYYGTIKTVVISFCTYYSQWIDEITIEADQYKFDVKKEDLLTLVDNTVNIYQINQVEFGREFLPVENSMEREIYDELEDKYNKHIIKLMDLGEKIQRLDKHKQDNIDDFATVEINKLIQRTSEMLVFSHGYISMMLSRVIPKVRLSLEEIHLRIHNNLLRIQENKEKKINSLLQELYDKNKEHTFLLCRQARPSLVQEAEVIRSLDLIKEKLETNSDYLRTKARIEDELEYWKRKLNGLQTITKIINDLKDNQKEMIKQEEDYYRIKSAESRGPKFSCWEEMGEKIRQRKEYLEEKLSEAAKMLVTFFSFRGTNRIFYTDHIGSYHVDEFNHQIYVFEYGLQIYHLNCKGEFIEVSDNAEYYFDENGRYIFENGEKVYQRAPCASKYKLKDDNTALLNKITADCGHSDENNLECRLKIKNHTDVEVLPMTDILDIKKTQSPEVVKYLWDNFGQILPDVLHDLGMLKPKNPIHHLAHKILMHRYGKTVNQLRLKSEEAQAYRAAIYRERKIKTENAAKAWKAKQVKRRKPEESENAQELAVYEAHLAHQKHINSWNYYNDSF